MKFIYSSCRKCLLNDVEEVGKSNINCSVMTSLLSEIYASVEDIRGIAFGSDEFYQSVSY